MKRGGQISGLVSMVTIFCALCLCVFSILTYAAADRELTLGNLTAQHAKEYYDADREAVVWLASLDAQSVPDGDTLSASFPMGDSQQLEVTVQRQGTQFAVMRWETVYSGDWQPDNSLPVWSGD